MTQTSLCYTVGPCWLFILFYLFIKYLLFGYTMQNIFNFLIKDGTAAPALDAWSLNWRAREILIIYFKYTTVKEQKEILFYFLVSFGDLDKWKKCLESSWHFSDQDMVKNNVPCIPKSLQPRRSLTEEQREGERSRVALSTWSFAVHLCAVIHMHTAWVC